MKIKKKHLYFVAVILVVIVILLLLRCCGSGESIGITDDKVPLAGLAWDANAEEGGLVQRSEEEIRAELNEKVAQGMINISMNTSPVFENGTAEGNLLIVNSERNNYPQIVTIVRKDTGEEIYRSGPEHHPVPLPDVRHGRSDLRRRHQHLRRHGRNARSADCRSDHV